MKSCYKCNKTKGLEEFYPHLGMRDGRLNQCKLCSKKSSREDYRNTPIEKRRAQRDAWRLSNKDKVKQAAVRYLNKHRGQCNAQTAKRRAFKKSATPKWLNKAHLREMRQFYIEAKELGWLSSERLEVDHIIPLVNEQVCGLHVPWNLQILPKGENVRKGNKL